MALVPYYTDNGSVFIVIPNVAGKEFKGVVQELTINPGERDIAVEHTFASSFVNTSRPELAELSFTMVASGGDIPLLIMGGSGTNAFQKHYVGDSSRVKPDIKYLEYDEDLTAQKQWIFSGAYITSMEESNATGEATTWDITAKALASNVFFKQTPNAGLSGLTAI